jgi:hypothetical protein
VVFWWIGIAVLALGCLTLLLGDGAMKPVRPRRDRKWEAALWAVALVMSTLALVIHRPDVDDALYLNIATSTADHPEMPLMGRDMMHGIEGLPLNWPVYLSDSYEVLWGMMSYLTGWNAQLWNHVFHTGLWAMLIVLALASLFRLLAPERWLVATCAMIFILIAAGGPQNHWYGNLSFIRVWQGKCTFMSVYLPLTFAYAMRFGMRPTLYGWILLASAQIAAVGMSSSAIWVEPMAAGIGLLCGAIGKGIGGWFRVILGCTSSAYVIGVGLRLKSMLAATSERILRDDFRIRDYNVFMGYQEVLELPGQALQGTWDNLLGTGLLPVYALGSLILGWVLCRHPLARRFAVIGPLISLGLIMNPYLEKLVMAHLIGPVHFRSAWLLPLPIFMALVFIAPLYVSPAQVSRKWVYLLMALMSVAYVERGGHHVFDVRKEWIHFGKPGVKIPPEPLRVIRQAMEELPPGAYILTPTLVSFWVPTFHQPLYPVTVHKIYTTHSRRWLTWPEVEFRIALTEYISGETREDNSPERLRKGVDYYGLQGVIVDLANPWLEEIEPILREKRFRPAGDEPEDATYALWLRPADDPAVLAAPRWKVAVPSE